MNEDPQIISTIKEAIKGRRCVPIVGAGASIAAGGPSWTAYLKELSAGLPEEHLAILKSDTEPIDIAESLEWLRSHFGMDNVPVSNGPPGEVHGALADWRCPLYLTTNFDHRLDVAIQHADVRAKIRGNEELEDFKLSRLLADPGLPPSVVKLCCSHSAANPGAIKRSDFSELLYTKPAAVDLLTAVLRCFTAVFIGCSIRDPVLSAALDRANVSRLGHGPHFAFLSIKNAAVQRIALKSRMVEVVPFKHGELVALLRSVGPAVVGGAIKFRGERDRRLLIFEPGTITKTQQVLTAANNIRDLKRIDFITSQEKLFAEIPALATEICPRVEIGHFRVDSLSDAELVTKALSNSPNLQWDGVFCPYEYAVADAASFVANSQIFLQKPPYHDPQAAAIARDKRLFRNFVASNFQNHLVVSATPFEIIKFDPNDSLEVLLQKITDALGAKSPKDVVVKPPNAAGSIGVRPINLAAQKEALRHVGDLKKVLTSMPFNPETAKCATEELIVESRLTGEEFSVESRKLEDTVEMLTVHWKVDIDSDNLRFFERLFVTIPPEMQVYRTLRSANEALLSGLKGLQDGVFHAEFRLCEKNTRAFPIELGLRPGGGMVNLSVEAGVGINLFEAGMRAAIGIKQSYPREQRIIGTGLVFTKTPGVLQLLKVRRPGGTLAALGKSDGPLMKDCLNALLAASDREKAKRDCLDRLLERQTPLSKVVRTAFASRGSTGLAARIESAEIWIEPGSLIAEEEAAYVAGILVAVDPDLSGPSAVAEAITAVEFCLQSVECETETPLHFEWRKSNATLETWNREFERSRFRSDHDSWTFGEAVQIAADTFPQAGILDLGCGSAIPVLNLLRAGRAYRGVDNSEDAIETARKNLTKLKKMNSVVKEDVRQFETWVKTLNIEKPIVAANLPYLPANEKMLPPEVDGGPDGLALIPELVLDIAAKLDSPAVVISISSICQLHQFVSIVSRRGYGCSAAVATIAPLEQYASAALDYILKLEPTGYKRLLCENKAQIIYSLVLSKDVGAPLATVFRECEERCSSRQMAMDTAIYGRAFS